MPRGRSGRSSGRRSSGGSSKAVGRLVFYVGEERKAYHLTNVWKGKDNVILSGKTTAEYFDEDILDVLDDALKNEEDIKFVVFKPFEDKEKPRRKPKRDDDYKDKDIEDDDDGEEEDLGL